MLNWGSTWRKYCDRFHEVTNLRREANQRIPMVKKNTEVIQK